MAPTMPGSINLLTIDNERCLKAGTDPGSVLIAMQKTLFVSATTDDICSRHLVNRCDFNYTL